LKNDLTCQNCQ